MKPAHVIQKGFWFFMDSGEPMPFDVFNLAQKQRSEACVTVLAFYRWSGLIGDINTNRSERVFFKASKFAFNQWRQKEVFRLLENRFELENFQGKIETEIEEFAVETKEKERLEKERHSNFYATAISKDIRFNEAVSKLPKSKEENLLILRELLGFP